jgi:tetratricopeptide (TPR) repeat protein
MEMDEELYEKIQALCAEGEALLDEDDTEGAKNKYRAALDLVPSPKTEWEAATWIYTAMGDTCFLLEEYKQAQDHFFDAYNCPGGIENPFIALRLGECLFETGNKEKATEYLLRAYMLEGDEIFEEEDEKYFALIKDKI